MDTVIIEGKEEILRDILLEIKYKKNPLFTGVEKGSRRKANSVFVLITPNLRKEAQYQLRENFGKTIVFVIKKSDYKILIPLLLTCITIYNNKLNEFIKISLASDRVMKINNFGIKYKSFTKVVTGLDKLQLIVG